MRRYRRLLWLFWSNTLTNELEYRVNFWSNAALSLFWLGWAALGMSVYFQFTEAVRGWTYPELLVVVGLFFAVNGIRQMIIRPNLSRMTEYVREGTLDFLLTKPVNSQFLVSFRHVGVYNWLDPVFGLALAGMGLVGSGSSVGWEAVGAFVVLFAAGCVLLYALALALMSLAIAAVSSEGMDDVLFGLVEAARLPVQFYRGVVQTLLTVLLPVAFLTTFPAEALLGRGDSRIVLLAPAVAAVAVAAASVVWSQALRRYTGASS